MLTLIGFAPFASFSFFAFGTLTFLPLVVLRNFLGLAKPLTIAGVDGSPPFAVGMRGGHGQRYLSADWNSGRRKNHASWIAEVRQAQLFGYVRWVRPMQMRLAGRTCGVDRDDLEVAISDFAEQRGETAASFWIRIA